MNKKRVAIAVAIALAAPCAAWAQDAAMPQFSFSGFCTLGFVSTNTDQAEIRDLGARFSALIDRVCAAVRRDTFPSDVPSPLNVVSIVIDSLNAGSLD